MKKRVISAIILIAVLVPILIIGGIPFRVMVTVLALGGLYELFHIKSSKKSIPLLMKILAYLAVIVLCYNNIGGLYEKDRNVFYITFCKFNTNYSLCYSIKTWKF